MTESGFPRNPGKFIHHPNLKPDRSDALSPYIKSLIVDNSPARQPDYIPEKVIIRTDGNYLARDSKAIATERINRMMVSSPKAYFQTVQKCGFASDPKELYRPLGEPIVDAHQLIYTSLRINPKEYETSNKLTISDPNEDVNTAGVSAQKLRITTPPRSSDGHTYLKRKLAKSKARINSVRFGVPFDNVCENYAKASDDLADEIADKRPTESNEVDWSHLEIDVEKRTYFTSLNNRYQQQKQKGEAERHILNENNRPKQAWGEKSPNIGHTTLSHKTKAVDMSSSVSMSGTESIAKLKMSVKTMETAMGIQRDTSVQASTQKFFKTRDEFYEQRQRLSYVLQNELNRSDGHRKTQFRRKLAAFEVGKKAMFHDDIKSMRSKAAALKAAEHAKNLKEHPWYNEFLAKIVNLNSTKSELSRYEKQLVDQITGYIEDRVPFKRSSIVNIIKTIPKNAFASEEIQRILRFIKAKENISERDYVEAVEKAGQTYV